MKLTKDNIVGIQFKQRSWGTVYTIKEIIGVKITLTWGSTSSTDWDLNNALRSLNSKDWLIISQSIKSYELWM